MKNLLFVIVALFGLSALVYAQPRPADKTAAPATTNAPASYKVRYEGGIFGTSQRETGTIKIDEENERLRNLVTRLQDRVATLETIATDPAERTAREIEARRALPAPEDGAED